MISAINKPDETFAQFYNRIMDANLQGFDTAFPIIVFNGIEINLYSPTCFTAIKEQYLLKEKLYQMERELYQTSKALENTLTDGTDHDY